MRRLIVLSAVLIAVHTPVGWASPPSLGGDLKECYDLEVTIPPHSPETTLCQPVIHVPPTDI